jgi:PKD repeat protein
MSIILRIVAIFFLCILLFIPVSGVETPVIIWERFLGGKHDDQAYSVQEIQDKGYIVVGSTCSNRWVQTSYSKYNVDFCQDIMIFKLNSSGKILWQRSFGGSGIDNAYSVDGISDGGCIVAGSTMSNDGNVTGLHGSIDAYDYWVVQLDPGGDLIWGKTYGGSRSEESSHIWETSDEEYLVVGYANSNDGDVDPTHRRGDYWVIMLSKEGDLLWQKSITGLVGTIWDFQKTSDHGFIIAGRCRPPCDNSRDCWLDDYWICKLDCNGTVLWQKMYGGSGSDIACCIRELPGDGFIVAGTTTSNDGDVITNRGMTDIWVIKLDESGDLIWQTSMGGSNFDSASSVLGTRDGGFIVTGITRPDGEVSEDPSRDGDIWVIKLDNNGTMVWDIVLDKGAWNEARSLIETSDNGFLIAGYLHSSKETIPGLHGGCDYYVVKMGALKSLPNTGRLPLDPDQDGKYEDINGDGAITFDDMFLFFQSMDWISQHEPIPCFDYNDDQNITWRDGLSLFAR